MTNTGTSTATAAVIGALSLLLSSGLLGAMFVYFRRLVEARIGATHTAQAIAVTGEAVRAAEQIGRTHGLDADAKYREAATRAASFLSDHGIALGDQQLRTLIEGAVTQIKQANAAAPMPGVVMTGENPTVNAPTVAPPVPVGPSPEQLIAAITTAIGAVYPAVGEPTPPPLPAPQPIPVAEPVPIVVQSVPTIAVQAVPLGPPTP